MIGLLDAPRRLHEELLAFQLDIRTKQAFNDVEDSGIPGGIAVDGIVGVAVVQLSDVSEPALPVGARLILDISLGISSDYSVRDIFGTLPERLDFLRLEHVLYDQKPVSVKLINQRLAERHVPLSLILFRGLVI